MRKQEGLGAADVVVVGGGVIGLAIARALAMRGAGSVFLIERASLGAEASRAAAGMLAPQAEADGADAFFELACASRDLYPSFADALREETGTDIELERTGTLYLAFTDEDEREIEHRFAWQRRTGLSVERLSAREARELEPCISTHVRGALRFPQDVQVENRRLIAALSASVESRGVRLLMGINVESLVIERGRVAGVETSRGRVRAPVVVVATGAWTSFLTSTDKAAPLIRIEPVRGQMLCFETNPRVARHVIYSPRGYIVPRLDGRLLAGSTSERAGFERRVTARGIQAITSHAIEIAPGLSDLPLVDSWAGLRPRAQDDWPVLGACSETKGLFFATGHYRNGILLAPLTGELIADEITTNITPPQLQAFSPDRFHLTPVGHVR
ncbi:MAG TPA: glycine oxidase ThiO [Pyrinomonadaceae bacterium]|nr:glycine oxidase ThiO [Pyrinomonadaceae bacterium]